MFSFSLLFGFVLGIVAAVAAEGLALYWILRRLTGRKRKQASPPAGADVGRDICVDQLPFTFPYEKQGFVWVLEQDKFLKNLEHDPQAKSAMEPKDQKEYVEVSPMKKKAEIKDRCLILKDLDDFRTTIIHLLDCKIEAISGSNFSSRKWMRKYPIRVESKNNVIYNGSKTCYVYLETSWDKESWCKALRLASCSDMEKINWYTDLSKEFQSYLTSLTSKHPLFLKTSAIPIETSQTTNKSNKMDENSSKVRHFFKKISRKASKIGSEGKPSSTASSNKLERKVSDKNHQNPSSTHGLRKSSLSEKSSLQDLLHTHAPSSMLLENQQIPASCDEGLSEKYGFDEGTFCLNLLLSRLFFDAKKSMEINNLIKGRIQRTLSNMRTPSFVGGLTCVGLNLGSRPPYMHSIRALPMDMKETWIVEVDVEYSGGLLLEIETRLEVCEPEFQKDIVSTSVKPGLDGEVASDILEGFNNYNQELSPSSDSDDEKNRPVHEIKSSNGDPSRQLRNTSWTSSYMSRWKTMLNSVVDHVSQVPISLEVSAASLRGTLRFQVKPPPSDQIWIGFTSMPELEFNFNSAIGDHKIPSTHLALLLGNRFKAAICESLVLPNCESVYVPWMLAEKDDWLPRNAAPFIWIRQESGELSGKDSVKSQHVESKKSSDDNKVGKTSPDHSSEHAIEEKISAECTHVSLVEPVSDDIPSETDSVSLFSSDSLTGNSELGDSKESLRSEDAEGSTKLCRIEPSEPYQTSVLPEHGKTLKHEESTKTRKTGKRVLIKDFGKKMSEKFDEKVRHTSRHVENVTTDDRPRVPDIANEATGKNVIEDGENREDMLTKKIGKRELIKDLGKKMSEKFEVKMRQIEEIGRLAVENVSMDVGARTSVPEDATISSGSVEGLRMPLLTNDDTRESHDRENAMLPCFSRTSTVISHEQAPRSSEEDINAKKIRRKESMWDLGKRVSEKFDEKRRHIEEKGRHIVGKMKENSRASDGSGTASFGKFSSHRGSTSFDHEDAIR